MANWHTHCLDGLRTLPHNRKLDGNQVTEVRIMCKLYALLANEPTKVECSLVRAQNTLMEQSRNRVPGQQRVNGWGVVCYDELGRRRIPSTVRHANGAFGSDHFSRSAAKVYSTSVVAHVRCASVGFTSTLNAHPFIHDEWTFAHNGTIPEFAAVSKTMEASIGERLLNCRLGTTDSELLFLWLLNRLSTHDITSDNVVDEQAQAREVLCNAISTLANECSKVAPHQTPTLNFVLTNGHALFACRWNKGLYHTTREGIYDCEICGKPHIHHNDGVVHRAVVVASEPITSEPWQELPNHSLLFVGPDMKCHIDKIPNSNLISN